MDPSLTPLKKNTAPKLSRRPSVSSELQDSVLSMVSEWRRPFSNFQPFREKQRSGVVSNPEQQLSELHEELKSAKEERVKALEGIAELKRFSGKSMQSMDKVRIVEQQAEKAMESERKMLEFMVYQTKQLEQTKISLEEARLEIRNLQESIRMIQDLSANKESSESVGTEEEMLQLRDDLAMALEAEQKSKKAMDELAVALMEVSAEANQAKAELSSRRSELEKAREEDNSENILLEIAEQKLAEALNEYDKLKLEYEESLAAWMKNEDDMLNCLRMSEENLIKEKQENSRVNNVWKAATEENSKLRDIIQQAANEASMVKEALEIARNENSQLKDQLFEKESSLQQARQDYESLKVTESAALHRLKELKCLYASTFAEVGPVRRPKGTSLGAKSNKCLKIFPSERWKPDYHLVNNGRRHSVGESGAFKGSDKGETHETKKMVVSSSSNVPVPLFFCERGSLNLESDVEIAQLPGTVKENLEKKKTILGRLGQTLRRRSIHN